MVHVITQIVRLKRVVKRWKNNSLRPRSRSRSQSVISYSSSSDSDEPAQQPGSNRPTPSGSLAVYVGVSRRRFVIPTRFLNLPVFVSLLDKAEEEFGFQSAGGLALPCEPGFFCEMLKLLDRNEQKFGFLSLDELVRVISEVDFEPLDQSCKEVAYHGFAPLLQNARV